MPETADTWRVVVVLICMLSGCRDRTASTPSPESREVIDHTEVQVLPRSASGHD
jgi:hypothetical protein